MINEKKNFMTCKLPLGLIRIADFQGYLFDLGDSMIDNCIDIYREALNTEKEEMICSIAQAYVYNFSKREIYEQLFFKMAKIVEKDEKMKHFFIKVSLLECPKLCKAMFDQNIFKIAEVMLNLVENCPFEASFVFCLDIPEYQNFVQTMKAPKRKWNDQLCLFDKKEEWIKYGWPLGSIGYYIKYDIIDGLCSYISSLTNFDPNDIIMFSPFDMSPKIESVSLLYIAAIYGSNKCFRQLIISGAIMSCEEFYAAFYSGSYEIIHFGSDSFIPDIECLKNAAKTFNVQLINWVLDNRGNQIMDLSYLLESMNYKLIFDLIINSFKFYSVSDLYRLKELYRINTPLHIAAKKNLFESFKFFFELGWDLNSKNSIPFCFFGLINIFWTNTTVLFWDQW